MRIKLKAIHNATGTNWIKLFDDESCKKSFEIRDVTNKPTPLPNVTVEEHYFVQVCPPEGYTGTICRWGESDADKIDNQELELPTYSAVYGEGRNFSINLTFNNIGSTPANVHIEAVDSVGGISSLHTPADFTIQPNNQTEVNITGKGASAQAGTIKLYLSTSANGAKTLWRTIKYGPVDYNITLWANASISAGGNELKEELVKQIDSVKVVVFRNNNPTTGITNNGKVEFNYIDPVNGQTTKELRGVDNYYIFNHDAMSITAGDRSAEVHVEYGEFGGLTKGYPVQGMEVTPDGTRFPADGDYTLSVTNLRESKVVGVNSSWLRSANFTLDITGFDVDNAKNRGYDTMIQVFIYNSTNDLVNTITPDGVVNITLPAKGRADINVTVGLLENKISACIQEPFVGEIKVTPCYQDTKTYEFHYSCAELVRYQPANRKVEYIFTKDNTSYTESPAITVTSLANKNLNVLFGFEKYNSWLDTSFENFEINITTFYQNGAKKQTCSLNTEHDGTIKCELPPNGTAQVSIKASIDPDNPPEKGDLYISYLHITPDRWLEENFTLTFSYSETGEYISKYTVHRDTHEPLDITKEEVIDNDNVCWFGAGHYTLCDSTQLSKVIDVIGKHINANGGLLRKEFAFGNDIATISTIQTIAGSQVKETEDGASYGDIVVNILTRDKKITCGVVTITAQQVGGLTRVNITVDKNQPWCDNGEEPFLFTGLANYDEDLAESTGAPVKFMRFDGDATELSKFRDAFEYIDPDYIPVVFGYAYANGEVFDTGSENPPIVVHYKEYNCSGTPPEGTNDCIDLPSYLQFIYRDFYNNPDSPDGVGYFSYQYISTTETNNFFVGIAYKKAMDESELDELRRILASNLISYWTMGNTSCIQDNTGELIGENLNGKVCSMIGKLPRGEGAIDLKTFDPTNRGFKDSTGSDGKIGLNLTFGSGTVSCRIWNNCGSNTCKNETLIKGVNWDKDNTYVEVPDWTVPTDTGGGKQIKAECYSGGYKGTGDPVSAVVVVDKTAPTVSEDENCDSEPCFEEGDDHDLTFTATDKYGIASCEAFRVYSDGSVTPLSCGRIGDSDRFRCSGIEKPPEGQYHQYPSEYSGDCGSYHLSSDGRACLDIINYTCTDKNGNTAEDRQIKIFWGESSIEVHVKEIYSQLINLANNGVVEYGKVEPIESGKAVVYNTITKNGDTQSVPVYYTSSTENVIKFNITGKFGISDLSCDDAHIIGPNSDELTPSQDHDSAPGWKDYTLDFNLESEGEYVVNITCIGNGNYEDTPSMKVPVKE